MFGLIKLLGWVHNILFSSLNIAYMVVLLIVDKIEKNRKACILILDT
jgi:hypothetical protein